MTIGEKTKNFFEKGTKVRYKKREIILRPNEPIFGIFYLKEGLVRQYALSEDGEETTIHLHRPGAFFPAMLVISENPNDYFFEAETDVKTFRERPGKVIKFLKENPDVLFDTTKRFAQAIVGLSKRIQAISTGNVHSKLVSLLIYLSSHFGEERGGNVVINLPFSHNDLATWLGVNRETISREMERLLKRGLISVEKHRIFIKNKQRFKEELETPTS